jgi:hypothetical protein
MLETRSDLWFTEKVMRLEFRPAIFIFLFVPLLASLTACGTDKISDPGIVLPVLQTSEPNAFPTSSELCGNVLYPTAQGATWEYASVGGPSGSFNYTNSITEVRADGFTLTSQFTDITRAQEWSCQPDGLKALQLGGGSAAGISIQGMTAELATSEIAGVSLLKDIPPGAQWQYSVALQGTIAMPGDQQSQSNGTYLVEMKEVGREIVTVPAGTFDAIKIQSNSTVDIIATFEGIEVPVKFNGTTITWYAPGVGYVKSVEGGDFGGTAFSAVTELQSYSIP